MKLTVVLIQHPRAAVRRNASMGPSQKPKPAKTESVSKSNQK
jgi:hypothetical protein